MFCRYVFYLVRFIALYVPINKNLVLLILLILLLLQQEGSDDERKERCLSCRFRYLNWNELSMEKPEAQFINSWEFGWQLNNFPFKAMEERQKVILGFNTIRLQLSQIKHITKTWHPCSPCLTSAMAMNITFVLVWSTINTTRWSAHW